MVTMQFERFYKGEEIKIINGMLPKGSRATISLTPSELKAKGYKDKKLYAVLLETKGYGHDCGGMVKTGNGWFVTESSLERAGE